MSEFAETVQKDNKRPKFNFCKGRHRIFVLLCKIRRIFIDICGKYAIISINLEHVGITAWKNSEKGEKTNEIF